MGKAGLPPLAIPVRPFVVLDNFSFDGTTLPSQHNPIVDRIGRLVVASRCSGQMITAIRLVGHTHPAGSKQYNLDLGEQRAKEVRAKVRVAITGLGSAPSGTLDIAVQPRGEAQQVAGNAEPEGRGRNRRVEVFLPITCQTSASPSMISASCQTIRSTAFLPIRT